MRPDDFEVSAAVQDEAVEICRNLIQIDSSNYGDGSGPGEREAAEYVMKLMTEVGLEPVFLESAPRRSNVIVRVPGRDSSRPALVVHGHTDVVPADPTQWSENPFGAELKDGMIWGRGAVDMKNMDAMILAVLREMTRTGRVPERDLIFAFFADEEAGGRFGSHWMVENHPELFAGATEAISEVGGYSVTVAGQRAYLIQTGEKGLAWVRLIAEGTAGHGSQVNPDNAVAKLAGALARIGSYSWPQRLTPTVDQLFKSVAELADINYAADNPASIDEVLDALGPVAKFVGATTASGVNPTQLAAGYKANVVPESAEAVLDVRTLPGDDEDVIATIRDLAGPGVRLEFVHRDIALESEFSGPLIESMITCLQAEDPGASVWPYLLSAGTDNKALSRLGITGYGFAPLQLPAELDFAGMFHGVDERVPVSAIRFGTRVLGRFLTTC